MSKKNGIEAVTNCNQISEILNIQCESKGPGIIRPNKNSRIGIRFAFEKFTKSSGQPNLLLTEISREGIKHLSVNRSVGIECYGNKMISFTSDILSLDQTSATVSIPNELHLKDRRVGSRIQPTINWPYFLKPSAWPINCDDLGAPPIVGMYQPLASYLMVKDISSKGVSVESRFPSFLNWIEKTVTCPDCLLITPLEIPIPLNLEMRWIKKVREFSPIENKRLLKFSAGFQFTRIKDADIETLESRIREFPIKKAL